MAGIKSELRRLAMLAGGVIKRGLLKRISSTLFCQFDSGFTDDVYQDVEIWQQHGFSSRMPSGTEAIIAKPGNSGEGAICIATNNRDHRPSISDGDTIVYSSDDGAGNQTSMKCRDNGDIVIDVPSSGTVTIGDSGHVAALKGGTFDSHYGVTYLSAMVAAGSVWNGSSKTLSDVVTYIDAHVAAISALSNSRAGLGWTCDNVDVS